MVPHAPKGLPAPFIVDAESPRIKIIRDKPPLAQFELPLDTHNGVNKTFVVRKVVRRDFLRERCREIQRRVAVKADVANAGKDINLYARGAIQGVCRSSLNDPRPKAGVRRYIQGAARKVRKAHLPVTVRQM